MDPLPAKVLDPPRDVARRFSPEEQHTKSTVHVHQSTLQLTRRQSEGAQPQRSPKANRLSPLSFGAACDVERHLPGEDLPPRSMPRRRTLPSHETRTNRGRPRANTGARGTSRAGPVRDARRRGSSKRIENGRERSKDFVVDGPPLGKAEAAAQRASMSRRHRAPPFTAHRVDLYRNFPAAVRGSSRPQQKSIRIAGPK